ncbi:coiled-coil-helix-coiled-coil-helix domain-containing protein 7 [Belonocnema kinseyi]|uniref:coiled-coil-helix-coiled-coil-helix domain-containing protein 7 n=1 Tax=Belonocnema kinseyi TaxID=2817044 RepID=UPI00143DBBEB|nr:coiled-coil-helix-coiled-coil-helix domain-containing protein 7 [Belonocnema kinseyi]
MRDLKEISRKNREYMERNNPCLSEEQLSKKCIEENNYDYDKCTLYFENVKSCREFWESVKMERRVKGIRPYLPYPDERAQIKAEHLRNQSQKS